MLETVDVGTQDLNLYERSAGAEAVAQLQELAAPLEGARVLHVNATPYGGGVAEILRSEIPLLRDLGILADWKLITGDQTFFSVTEAIHNGLQGAPRELTPAEQETYLTHAARNAQLLEEEYDLVVVHDPQPLPLLKLHGKGAARWVWRCHIDTSEPKPHIWDFLRPYLQGFRSARRRGGRSLLLPGEKVPGSFGRRSRRARRPRLHGRHRRALSYRQGAHLRRSRVPRHPARPRPQRGARPRHLPRRRPSNRSGDTHRREPDGRPPHSPTNNANAEGRSVM
jgi:hypothetical protein